jgi:penicillin-binding protein 1A
MPEKKKIDGRKPATKPRSKAALLGRKVKRLLLRAEKSIYDAADYVLEQLQEAELPDKFMAFLKRTRPGAKLKTVAKLFLLFILFCLDSLRRTPWHKLLRKAAYALRIKTFSLARTSKWQLAALILLAMLMLGGVGAWGLISYFSRGLPDIDQLAQYNPPVTTRLYAADGRLVEEYAKERRIYVPITAMPRVLINAFLAAEDRNFYTHPGVDVFSILRAIVQNALNRFSDSDRGLIGASTITQQVAKNILLSRERTYQRKFKEAILAMRMTQAYSKDRILELYLNEIYLGSGSYGVAAAALNYFNKSIDELSVEEAALLAAMPKAPSAFDPRNHYARARERRDWVIGRMYEEGFITEGQAKTAVAEPIRLRSRGNLEMTSADFFAEEVRRALEKVYGHDALYSGGLTVMTTLDPHLQKLAEQALRQGLMAYDTRKGFHGRIAHIRLKEINWAEALAALEPPAGLGDWQLAVVLGGSKEAYEIGLKEAVTGSIAYHTMEWATHTPDGRSMNAANVLEPGDVVAVERIPDVPRSYLLRQIPKVSGALVAMDPHTGRVLAMEGGYAYDKTQFNRATQARRQPGSAFKPFVYTAALENGFTPGTLINDEPIEFEMTGKPKTALAPSSEDPALTEEIKVWAPQNYSGNFYGPTTLRTGLEKSRNVMTVRLGLAMGVDKVVNIAKRFDINQNAEPNLSTVLGSSETTLLSLTNAYGMLVNGGKRIFPAMIERIQDRNGQTIYRRDTRVCDGCFFKSRKDLPEEFTPPVLVDDREEVTDSFTAYQMVSLMEGVVKRGTGVRAQVIGKPIGGKTGTTNESRDAWFVGFSPDLVAGVYVGFDTPMPLGKEETGASVALPIFVDFMQGALKDTPAIPFRIPSGMKLVKIDMKTGFLPSEETPENEILLEAFKPGTEPKIAIRRSEMLSVSEKPDAAPGSEEWKKDPRARDLPETRGTGGIY